MEIQGLVLAGRDDQPAVRAALSDPQNHWRPAPGFILLDAGRAPGPLPGLAWLLGAVVAFLMMGFLIRDGLRRGRPAPTRGVETAATPPAQAANG
jgi:predicted anti-sigma-YlaC factor YlaD